MRVRFHATAGTHLVGATFPATNLAPGLDLDKHFMRSTVQTGPTPGYTFFPHVGTIRIEGPFDATQAKDSPSRRKIFVCTPKTKAEEATCARRIVTNLATFGFRRPTTAADIDVLMEFYEFGRKEKDFDQGIEMALARVLASPQFIYRIEEQPVGTRAGVAYRISDVDLASRLSFFLWSSAPDEELLKIAAAGRLNEPVMLERQVRRMLRHPKAIALADNFAGQWLNLRALDVTTPLPLLYPNFDDPLRQAMRKEVELLFDTIVREDRSVRRHPQRRLHVRQRTAGQALRDQEHHRQPVPSRDARSGHGLASWSARQGRVPGNELEARSHVTGHARQVDHGQRARHEPAESAARRAAAAAARRGPERERADDAQEDGRPSRAP